MSLLPLLFDDFDVRPTKRQKRGLFDDFFEPSSTAVAIMPRGLFDLPDYLKNLNAALKDTKDSRVNVDKDKFQANFDVQHFKPEEITVKVSEDKRTITIEAEHEEKQDEHGQIYRHFVRKYTLPKDCNINQVESKLSSDGVLSITAPRIGRKRKHEEEHRSIPIIQTGQPAKSVENKFEKKDKNEKMDTR